MGKRERGISFTELLLVVVGVLMLGAGTLVHGSSAVRKANEAAAIAALKNIAAAQQRCRLSVGIDADGDRQGEFGFLAELAGTVPVRSQFAYTKKLSPPLLSSAFGVMFNSYAFVQGYFFQMYLPDYIGAGLAEQLSGGDPYNSQGVDPWNATRWWTCYAWPQVHGRTGNRTFFVDQSGEILATDGTVFAYGGLWKPSPSAAFALNTSGLMGCALAANTTGWDGNLWYFVE